MNWLLSKIKGDGNIWLIVFLLTVASVLVVYSSTGTLAFARRGGNTEYYLFRQLGFIFVGLLFMYGAHRINYIYYSRIAQILLYVSFPLLVLTYLMGPTINDARRWLEIPGTGFTFQTSDLAKLALIMYLARVLSKGQENIKDFKKTFLPAAVAISAICLFIAPSNLSTALLLFASSIILLFIGRVSFKYLSLYTGGILVLGILVILIAIQFGAPGRTGTWKSRIETFISGGSQDESYQAQQSKIAIAKGGIFGKGPGHSIQKNFLPNPYADFIYAVIIEEYGILGGIAIMIIYLYLLFRTIRIVIQSPNAFGALLAAGLSISLVLQAFINMCVATNLLPVTGLPLPLVSMGGTSMLFTSISFGIILSVSRNIEENKKSEQKMELA